MLSSFFYLLATFLLLGLFVCNGDFCVVEGGGSRTPNLLMSEQPAAFETQTNQHHAQQQGRGDAQLYNSRSPQTDCPWTRARLEKRAPAIPEKSTAVARRLGGRGRTSRMTSARLECGSFPFCNAEVVTTSREPQQQKQR